MVSRKKNQAVHFFLSDIHCVSLLFLIQIGKHPIIIKKKTLYLQKYRARHLNYRTMHTNITDRF